jgi:hypothetical protein
MFEETKQVFLTLLWTAVFSGASLKLGNIFFTAAVIAVVAIGRRMAIRRQMTLLNRR